MICATPTSPAGGPSLTITAAPRAIASGTNRRASCLKPGTATKQSPGATFRESAAMPPIAAGGARSEEHTSELQSQSNLVCRLLLEKKKDKNDGDLATVDINVISKP